MEEENDNEQETKISDEYDSLFETIEHDNKIELWLTDEPVAQQSISTYRYNPTTQEEFFNVIYSDRSYLVSPETKIKISSITIGDKEIKTATELDLVDDRKCKTLETLKLEMKEIKGIKIKCVVAVYNNKKLWIYLPKLEEYSKESEEILEYVMAWGVELYKKAMPKTKKEKKQDIRKEIESIVVGTTETRRHSVEKNKEQNERDVGYALKALQIAKDQVEIYNKKLEELKTTPNFTRLMNKEMRLLRGNKMIKDIKIKDKVIYVFTKPVKLKVGNYIYDLGCYEMVLDLLSSNTRLRVFNQNIADRKKQHPHIDSEGHCCLGNIQNKITKLLDNNKFAEVITIIIAYLHAYNATGAYINIESFREENNIERIQIKKGKPRRKRVATEPITTGVDLINEIHERAEIINN